MAAEKPARDRLTNEDFSTIQSQLTVFGGAVMTLDLEAFIDRCSHAEAVAPFIDPTAFMQGHEKLAALKDLAEGALKFKLAAHAFRNTMLRLDAKAAMAAEVARAKADVEKKEGGG